MAYRIASMVACDDHNLDETTHVVSVEKWNGRERVVVRRCDMPGSPEIVIKKKEWPDLKDAIENMINLLQD